MAMVIRGYRPAPPLSDLVEVLWSCHGDPPPHAKERILPTGTLEMVIDLEPDGAGFGPILCGAQSKQPYGERGSGVEDPCGNCWYIATYTGRSAEG